MDKDVTEMYTSGEFLDNNPTWDRENSEEKVEGIFNAIPESFWENFDRENFTIADVGCGAGGIIGIFSEKLKQKGFKITSAMGCDIADVALEMARGEWGDIEFYNGEITESKKNFDLGLLFDVIEHVEEPEKLIRDVSKHCRYIIFRIPMDYNWNVRIRNRYKYLADTFGHINYYDRKRALNILEEQKGNVIYHKLFPGFKTEFSRRFLSKTGFAVRYILNMFSPSLTAELLGGYSLMVIVKSGLYEEID